MSKGESLDLVKVKIEKIPYEKLRAETEKRSGGISVDSMVKKDLRERHGLVILPDQNPDIFYAIDTVMLEDLGVNAHWWILADASRSMALNAFDCLELWKMRVEKHNDLQ